MTVSSSHKARVLWNSYDISAKLSSASVSRSAEMLDVSTLNDSTKRFIAGVSDSTLSVQGWLDSTANAAVLTDIDTLLVFGLPFIVSYAPRGLTAGEPVMLASGWRAGFETGSPVNGVTNFSASVQSDAVLGQGVSILDSTAVTGDTNHASYDRGVGVSTSGGAVAHLHSTAFSGLTNNVVTIEDSANNIDFSTIGTFTTITAVGGLRLTISGTVRRYVRAVSNVTGTGSNTIQVSIAFL